MVSTALFNQPPYKNLIVNGLVLARSVHGYLVPPPSLPPVTPFFRTRLVCCPYLTSSSLYLWRSITPSPPFVISCRSGDSPLLPFLLRILHASITPLLSSVPPLPSPPLPFFPSSELLLLHRYFYEQLSLVPSLPRNTQLDEFFCTVEKALPSMSLYSSFMESSRQQNLQASLTGIYIVKNGSLL